MGAAFPGPIGRYLSGLCVAGLGLCAAGWLVLTPFAFGYQGRGWHHEALIDLATGAGLAVACLITLVVWAVAWRRALRADGVLTRPSRGQARRQARAQRRRQARAQRRRERGHGGADPDQVLAELRTLLAPLLDPPAAEPVAAVVPGPRNEPGEFAMMPVEPGGITTIQSMLSGAELLMTGCEEEAW